MKIELKVEQRNVSEIKPYDRNPRKNAEAVDAVAKSITEFGFRQPIVVDADGVIVIGDTRYKAALKLGLEQVPVHVATGLSKAKIKALRIADNKTGDLADWDYELLPIELGELRAEDYDLGALGFDERELTELLDPSTIGNHDEEKGPDKDVAFTAADEPKIDTKPGQIWILGDHRLLCGDATDESDEIIRRWQKWTGREAVLEEPVIDAAPKPTRKRRAKGTNGA